MARPSKPMAAAVLETDARLGVLQDRVASAFYRLKNWLPPTPLLNNPVIDDAAGCSVFLKAEPLQPTGSFKVRGAFNRLMQLSKEGAARGVVAWSAGNHGQALAYVGRLLNISVVVVAPNDAPKVKLDRMRDHGAEVVLYDRATESREGIGQEIARDTGRIIVPPFDDLDVMAGQGTLAIEAYRQAAVLGVRFDSAVVCVGGGGLISGIGLGLRAMGAATRLYSAEPEGYDDTRRSLIAKARVKNDVTYRCISDALMTETPGELTFPIMQELVNDGFSVSEQSIRLAMRLCFDHARIVLEPGGAAALAAVLSYPDTFKDQNVLITLSGGNVDPSLFCEMLADEEVL
ncbi:MAG: threonine/serine dehydratase [Pseudomonadota bacterium]